MILSANNISPLENVEQSPGHVLSDNVSDLFHILSQGVNSVRIQHSSNLSLPIIDQELAEIEVSSIVDDLLTNTSSPLVQVTQSFRNVTGEIVTALSDKPPNPILKFYAASNKEYDIIPDWHQDVKHVTVISSCYGPGIEYVPQNLENSEIDSLKESGVNNQVVADIGDIVAFKGKKAFTKNTEGYTPAVWHRGLATPRISFVHGF